MKKLLKWIAIALLLVPASLFAQAPLTDICHMADGSAIVSTSAYVMVDTCVHTYRVPLTALFALGISNTPYDAAAWLGMNTVAPSQNAVRNALEILIARIAALNAGTAVNPAGLNKQVQFNDGSIFGGDSTFTFDKATKILSVSSIKVGTMNISSLPTSNVSLSTGDLWVDTTAGYVIKVAQ